MFLLIFIVIFHELGHLLAASMFGINASVIKFYSFGGITEYDIDINTPINKEIVIMIMGPIFQVVLIIVVFSCRSYIDYYTFEKFLEINKLLLMFNMLPIINLDGGKLLNLILNKFFSYKTSFVISIVVSFMVLPFIVFFEFNLLTLFLVCFLFVMLIDEVKKYKHAFNKFLLERYLYDYRFKKRRVISNVSSMKKDAEHVFVLNGRVVTEKEYLREYFS